jgi:predicted dehydrogenase
MTLRLAFWGAGIVSGPYGQALAETSSVEFVGVWDPDAARSRQLAKGLGGRAFASADELLASPEVDAVAILSPNTTHVDVALQSLDAGKHVIIEKPVAETHDELAILSAAAKRAGRVCMPAHNYIYHPSVMRARKLVKQGAFGRVASLWILYNIFHSEELAERYGGVLREVCVHHAYSLIYLLGRPKSVSAMSSCLHYERLTCEDMVNMICRMEDGVLANLWCSFAASDPTSDPWTVTYKILGDKGGVVHSWNSAVFDDTRGPGYGFPDYLDGFRNELVFFAEEAVGKGNYPLSGLQQASDAISIIEAAEASIRDSGRETLITYTSI